MFWNKTLWMLPYLVLQMRVLISVEQAPCVVSLYWWCNSLYDTHDIPHKTLIIPKLNSAAELSESHLQKRKTTCKKSILFNCHVALRIFVNGFYYQQLGEKKVIPSTLFNILQRLASCKRHVYASVGFENPGPLICKN